MKPKRRFHTGHARLQAIQEFMTKSNRNPEIVARLATEMCGWALIRKISIELDIEQRAIQIRDEMERKNQ